MSRHMQGVYVRLQKSDIHGIGVFPLGTFRKGLTFFQMTIVSVWRKIEELNLNELPESVRRLYEDFCLVQDKGSSTAARRPSI